MRYLEAGEIKEIAERSADWIVNGIVEVQNEVLSHYGFTEPHRYVMLMAQLMHESAHFRTLKEFHDGSNYEGRKDLGNVRRGDGKRFRGSGLIQRTGRANTELSFKYWFKEGGRVLERLIAKKPNSSARWSLMLRDDSRLALEDACLYWTRDRDLHRFADLSSFEDALRKITKQINGGYNGLEDRRRCARAFGLSVLGYESLRELQKDKRIEVDGEWGPNSDSVLWKALQESDFYYGELPSKGPHQMEEDVGGGSLSYIVLFALFTAIAIVVSTLFGLPLEEIIDFILEGV